MKSIIVILALGVIGLSCNTGRTTAVPPRHPATYFGQFDMTNLTEGLYAEVADKTHLIFADVVVSHRLLTPDYVLPPELVPPSGSEEWSRMNEKSKVVLQLQFLHAGEVQAFFHANYRGFTMPAPYTPAYVEKRDGKVVRAYVKGVGLMESAPE